MDHKDIICSIILIVLLSPFVIRWFVSLVRDTERNADDVSVFNGDPYRTPAVVIQEQPKIKKEDFKMPEIKLGKNTKTVALLMPVCGSFVGMGALHDAPLLGEGVKWGGGIALLVIVIFFSIALINHCVKAYDQ